MKGRVVVERKNKVPPVGEDQVQDQLRNLKVHKSMRHDEMHLWILREVLDEVTKPLSYLKSHVSPVKFLLMERGEIQPTFLKKGEKNDPQSFRPVSLTSVPGEITKQISWKLC